MPAISLRLTDEEHAALKEWAHGSHRSMQREAVFRIFQERVRDIGWATVGPDAGKVVEAQLPERAATNEAETRLPTEAPQTVTDRNARSGSCPMNTAAGSKCKVCGKVHPL